MCATSWPASARASSRSEAEGVRPITARDRALATPEISKHIAGNGLVTGGGTPGDLGAFLARDTVGITPRTGHIGVATAGESVSGAHICAIGCRTDRFGCRWGVFAMNWKERIEVICAQANFSEPAEEHALFAAETQLGMRLPQSLRELLAESNGVRGEYDLALIWPIERIVADNRSFRESKSFRTLYMPFEGLLFFADAGNGDQFAFAVAGGQVRRPDIFVWNHEDDSRTWLAKNLHEYLEGWVSGRIAI